MTPASVMARSDLTSTPISRAAASAVMVQLSAKAAAIRASVAGPIGLVGMRAAAVMVGSDPLRGPPA